MEKNKNISSVSPAGIGILVFAAIVVIVLIVYWIGVVRDVLAAGQEVASFLESAVRFI